MKQVKIIEILTSILPYFAVFFASLFHPYDNDLGWHLRYGQYFFQNHRILRENIFSTEMPNYHWVNSSWLTDLISFATFNMFGFLGLSILGALTITATFYFFARSARLDLFEKALIFPFLLYFLSPLNSVSFRGQLLSLLFLGILTYILTKVQTRFETDRQTGFVRLVYLLPPLFAFWSNTHGQFILGLVVFAIWIASTIVSDLISNGLSNARHALRNTILPTTVFIASVLAVLINPFGFGVYIEAIKHFNNPLSKYIAEWVGTETLSTLWWHQVLLGLSIFFGLIFLTFLGKIKENLPAVSLASILYLISFNARRFAWPMYYFSLPLLKPLATFFKPDSQKYATISATLILLSYLVSTFFIDNPIKRTQNMSWQSYCQKFVQCSDGAINYLTSNPPAGGLDVNLLTAPASTQVAGEAGYSAFEDYFDYEQNMADIDESTYDVVLMSNQKPVYKRLEKLTTEDKWQKVYEDEFAGVFVRKPL